MPKRGDATNNASSVFDPYATALRAGRSYLGARDVHVWLCPRSLIPSSDSFKRRVLSQYAAVKPAGWRFVRGERGKPRLAGTTHALDFNLSHSGDWQACAVTAGVPVGVDIEQCNPERDVMTLARRFFRAEETAALESSRDGAGQCDRFYDLWTLKESAVKARGDVLVSGLNSRGFALAFERRPAPGRIALTTAEDGGTAQYCLLDPLPGYRLALCWLPETPLPPQLQVFELCDGATGRALDLPLRAGTWIA